MTLCVIRELVSAKEIWFARFAANASEDGVGICNLLYFSLIYSEATFFIDGS